MTAALLVGACGPDQGSVYGAADACRQIVAARLKAPSTANLPLSKIVTDLDSSRYMVAGIYDAQNSFGAMLRGKYVCTVRYNSFTKEYTLMAPLAIE